MLYYLLYPLREFFGGFNVVRYITFRSAVAAVTAFLLCVIFGGRVIAWLSRRRLLEKIGQKDSDKLNELQQGKSTTPTMGGVLILGSLLLSLLLWANWTDRYVWYAMGVIVSLGCLGMIDDTMKLRGVKRGLAMRFKLAGQIVVGLIIGYALLQSFRDAGQDRLVSLFFPFFKKFWIDLTWAGGVFFVLLVALVIVSASNAVNLTDGLDGLATGCALMVGLAFTVISYVVGRVDFCAYLGIPHVPEVGEITVVGSALLGSCLGFLWFNAYPAQIFMGDTGSLALGGLLGYLAVVTRQEMLLFLIGGIFVAEAFSVLLQIISFRGWGKRIFRIAPLHHHFQFLGWPETKVTVRFWILGIILALLALATLKLR